MVICRAAVLLAGTIALLLPTPSAVHAATVSHASGAATLTNGSTLTITGEGTEADDLQVSSADGFTMLVVTGPTARAGEGCQQRSAEVRCPLATTLAPTCATRRSTSTWARVTIGCWSGPSTPRDRSTAVSSRRSPAATAQTP